MKRFDNHATKLSQTRVFCGKTIEVEGRSFKVEECLKDGEFAVNFRVRDLASDEHFALKHITVTDENVKNAFTHEFKIMKTVQDHPNVVSVHSIAFGVEEDEQQDAFMIMELCTETLVNFLEKRNFEIQDSQRHDIFLSVCKAVQHLHKQQPPVLHQDINVKNILRGANGNWVLSGFSSARLKTHEISSHTNQQVEISHLTTPAYRSPEMWDVMTSQKIDEKSDIWSLGCLLYYLCCGSLPFTGESRLEVLAGKTVLPSIISPRFSKIIAEMLEVDPTKRPSIDSVIFMLEASNQWTQVVPGDPFESASESTEFSQQLGLDQKSSLKQQISIPAAPDFAQLDKNGNLNNLMKSEIQGQVNSEFNGEMKALRIAISSLEENNQLLWSKLVSLEENVQSQEHSILQLQNAEQESSLLISAGSIYSPRSEFEDMSFKHKVCPVLAPVKNASVIESQSPPPHPDVANAICELKTPRNTKWNLMRISESARNLSMVSSLYSMHYIVV